MANFVPSDGLVSEFVPIALGWYGDLGSDAVDFVRRIVEHHFGEGYVAQWKIRKTLAQIEVKHLNCLGTYLCRVRHDMEVRGPLLGREKWEHACLRERARGMEASSRASHGGRMCISQVEQLGYMSVGGLVRREISRCMFEAFLISKSGRRRQVLQRLSNRRLVVIVFRDLDDTLLPSLVGHPGLMGAWDVWVLLSCSDGVF